MEWSSDDDEFDENACYVTEKDTGKNLTSWFAKTNPDFLNEFQKFMVIQFCRAEPVEGVENWNTNYLMKYLQCFATEDEARDFVVDLCEVCGQDMVNTYIQRVGAVLPLPPPELLTELSDEVEHIKNYLEKKDKVNELRKATVKKEGDRIGTIAKKEREIWKKRKNHYMEKQERTNDDLYYDEKLDVTKVKITCDGDKVAKYLQSEIVRASQEQDGSWILTIQKDFTKEVSTYLKEKLV